MAKANVLEGKNICLSFDLYDPANFFFAKPLMKVLYEGRMLLRARRRNKPYGPSFPGLRKIHLKKREKIYG